jgi:hypothetical protein
MARRTHYEHWAALQVGYLILETEDFIVFLDEVGEIDWSTKDEFDKTYPHAKDLAAIRNRLEQLQDADGGRLSADSTRRFRCMVGGALARAFDGHIQEAKDALDKAETFVLARTRAAARYSYFIAGAACLGIVLILTLALWAIRDPLTRAFGPSFVEMTVAAGAGATGAFFSMLLQMRSAPIDPASEKHQQYADASARILMGMIGAIVVALFVRAGIVFPQLKPSLDAPASYSGLLLACIVSGASERLAPALIDRIGKVQESEPSKVAAPNGQPE